MTDEALLREALKALAGVQREQEAESECLLCYGVKHCEDCPGLLIPAVISKLEERLLQE